MAAEEQACSHGFRDAIATAMVGSAVLWAPGRFDAFEWIFDLPQRHEHVEKECPKFDLNL